MRDKTRENTPEGPREVRQNERFGYAGSRISLVKGSVCARVDGGVGGKNRIGQHMQNQEDRERLRDRKKYLENPPKPPPSHTQSQKTKKQKT